MQLRAQLVKLLHRFRYPVSLPHDIAHDLGLNAPPTTSLAVFLEFLCSSSPKPCRLRKWMMRCQAEASFQTALKKETFGGCSLFSYGFNKGWLVIALYFDERDLLRRAFVHCPTCEGGNKEGFDLILEDLPLSSLRGNS